MKNDGRITPEQKAKLDELMKDAIPYTGARKRYEKMKKKNKNNKIKST